MSSLLSGVRLAIFLLKPCQTYSLLVSRGKKQWLRPYLQSLYKRRLDQGPEPERPRSIWANWNYDAEIFSFGKRLGEEFKSETLRRAFVHSSYVEKENSKRAELGLQGDTTALQLSDNEEFVKNGEVLSRNYVIAYLRHCYPLMPDDGIRAVMNHLMSDETLCYIASNLGIKDLILTAEFPPSSLTMCRTFKAIIGALQHDQGQGRAELFVQDFILTQLVGKTIHDLWQINDPMGRLAAELKNRSLAEPEPRLLRSTGSSTILASYIVGIYSDKKLIGKGPGETPTIAEEMAARDALLRLYDLSINRSPLPLGQKGHVLKLQTEHIDTIQLDSSVDNKQLT